MVETIKQVFTIYTKPREKFNHLIVSAHYIESVNIVISIKTHRFVVSDAIT